MHEGGLERGPLVGDETEGLRQIVFAHRGLKIGEVFVVGFALPPAPFREQAQGQAAQHAQNPQAIGTAHAAVVVVERHIQPLMAPVFDPPAFAVGLQPLARREFGGGQIGEQAHRLIRAPGALAGQLGGLCGEGEAEGLGGDRAGFQRAALRRAFVLFHGARPGGRRG